MTTTSGPRRFTFCRLHFLTWLVLGAGLFVLWQAQWEHVRHRPNVLGGIGHGWPAFMTSSRNTGLFSSRPYLTVHAWHAVTVAFNLLACVAMLSATLYLVERALLSPQRYQFQIATLLKATLAVAVTFALLNIFGETIGVDIRSTVLGIDPPELPPGVVLLNPVGNALPWHLQIPLALGILCTVYVGIEFSSRLCRSIFPPEQPKLNSPE